MTKQTRRLVMLSAALVLASLLAWALLRPEVLAPAPGKESSAPKRLILAGEVADVQIRRGDAGYAMNAQGVEGLPVEITNSALVSETLSALSNLLLIPLEGEAAAGDAYGLGAGATHAKVRFAAGGGYALDIGAEEIVSGRRYCRLEGRDTLFLMDGSLGGRLAGSREGYLSMQITPVCRSKSALSAVKAFIWESDSEQIHIRSCDTIDGEMTAELLSFGAVTHVISGPGILHEVDRTYAEKVFSSLFDLKALDIVACGLSPEEVRERGFDQPDLKLCVEIKNGDAPKGGAETWTLRVLRENGETALVTLNDTGTVYRIMDVAFLRAKYEDFVCRWFLSPLMMDLSELRIFTPKKDCIYEICGDASNLYITFEGNKLDLARFRSFYTLVVSAASNGDTVSDADSAQIPVSRIEFVYRNKDKGPDVLAFRKLDTRRVSVSVNGVTEFAMRSGYLDALYEAMTALESDKDIPKIW